jgi:hypothetical protein
MQAKAEADKYQAEAERRRQGAAGIREERDETLRRADARDPDVETDDDGYRLDENGQRVDRNLD